MTDKERHLLLATAQAVAGLLGTISQHSGRASLITDVLAAMHALEFEQIEIKLQAARRTAGGKHP